MASTAHTNLTLFSTAIATTTYPPHLHRPIRPERQPRPAPKRPNPKHRGNPSNPIPQTGNRSDPTNLPTHLLSRLIKSDLIAAMNKLMRQYQCAISAKVFATVRSEYGADLDTHAELVVALARNGLTEEIDLLIDEMENEGGIESKGLLRLVKALIAAGRKESTVRIYGMMKRLGYEMDDYLEKVLSKALRRFGEWKLADEVDLELGRWL